MNSLLVDGDREYEIVHGTQAWRAALDWARFHGLDPMRIPAESMIERDGPNRCIRYTAFVKTGPGVGDILIEDNEPVTVECIEQGEAPPLSLPREVIG